MVLSSRMHKIRKRKEHKIFFLKRRQCKVEHIDEAREVQGKS